MTQPIRRTRTLLLLPFLAATGLIACGAGAQDAPPPDRASADFYEVTIGGGPFAGTHRGTGELNCFAQEGTWGVDVEEERDRGLSMMYLMLQGVPESGGATEDVTLGLTFGRLDDMSLTSGTVGIGSASGGGTGRATAERQGEGAVIRVEGTTADGSAVTVVVRCGSV